MRVTVQATSIPVPSTKYITSFLRGLFSAERSRFRGLTHCDSVRYQKLVTHASIISSTSTPQAHIFTSSYHHRVSQPMGKFLMDQNRLVCCHATVLPAVEFHFLPPTLENHVRTPFRARCSPEFGTGSEPPAQLHNCTTPKASSKSSWCRVCVSVWCNRVTHSASTPIFTPTAAILRVTIYCSESARGERDFEKMMLGAYA